MAHIRGNCILLSLFPTVAIKKNQSLAELYCSRRWWKIIGHQYSNGGKHMQVSEGCTLSPATQRKSKRYTYIFFVENLLPNLIRNILRQNFVAMHTLRHTFVILQFIGMWPPVHWLPGWKMKLYHCYTWFTMMLVVTVIISELIELVNSFGDVATLANNSFLLLTLIADCSKGVNILKKRSEIIELIKILQQDSFRPSSEKEFAIQRRFDQLIRSNTLRYAALVGLTVIGLIMKSIVEDVPRRALPYGSWLPFDYYASPLVYSLAFIQQIGGVMAGGAVTTAFDTLLPGLMLQTCAQLNILKCRFHDMSQSINIQSHDTGRDDELNLLIAKLEKKLLAKCVKHHIQIFKFAKKSNDLFGLVVFVQYTISTLVLCVSVFELSSMKLFGTEFVSLFLYIICIAVQIFNYCYYGCEVTLESLAVGDAVYEGDWVCLSINAKRSLLTIMARALRPIKFTTGHIITLNLDGFNSLLKLSYSSYNVLQQS